VNASGDIEIDDKSRERVDGREELTGEKVDELGENLEVIWKEFLYLEKLRSNSVSTPRRATHLLH
jgi:hypothetical protein